MIYELELVGPVPNKKDYMAEGTTKAGKKFRYYKNSVQDAMNALAVQIPGYMRGLMLEHPDITVLFTVPNGRCDRDGCLTTILDLLGPRGNTGMRVLAEDNIAHCNGHIHIPPAQLSDSWLTEITLVVPDEPAGVPRGTRRTKC